MAMVSRTTTQWVSKPVQVQVTVMKLGGSPTNPGWVPCTEYETRYEMQPVEVTEFVYVPDEVQPVNIPSLGSGYSNVADEDDDDEYLLDDDE